MSSFVRVVLLALACALPLGAARAAGPPPRTLPGRMAAALERLQKTGCHGEDWTAVASDNDFSSLPSRDRAITYLNLAACVGGARLHEWRVLASKEPDTPPLAWGLLFLEAVDAHDTAGAFADLEADLAPPSEGASRSPCQI